MPAWWRSSCGSPCCDGSVFTKNKNAGLTSSVFSATIHLAFAGVAHLVERDLAKVEVASSSLVARSKKERHPHGCLSFLEQHFCYAKVVACGRVTEREWGNPSKGPPSHSPFLAVGGSADNKTCRQSQKETPSVRMVFSFWNAAGRLELAASTCAQRVKSSAMRLPVRGSVHRGIQNKGRPKGRPLFSYSFVTMGMIMGLRLVCL